MAGKKKKKRNKEGKEPKLPKLQAKGEKMCYWVREPIVLTSAYENRRWHDLQRDVIEMVDEEAGTFKIDKSGQVIPPNAIKNRTKAFNYLAERYLRYTVLAKQLEDIYNFMVHPQKRSLVRTLLTDIIARILEFKEQMVKIDEREYHFFDDIIQDFQLIPKDFDLKVPRFFREEQYTALQNREFILQSILGRSSDRMLQSSKTSTITRQTQLQRLHFEVFLSVLKIQKNHRGYMGLRSFETRASSLAFLKHQARSMHLLRKFADKWLCFISHKQLLAMKEEEMKYLGMLPKPDDNFVSMIEDHMLRNKMKAEDNLLKLEADKIMTEEEIVDNEGYDIAWALKYNITQWLLETKSLLGNFPVFPPEEKGGSKLLFSNKSLMEVQRDIEQYMEQKSKTKTGKKEKKGNKKKKEKKKKKKDKKDKKDKKGKKGKKKKGKEDGDEFEWTMPFSKVLPELTEANDAYRKFWYFKDDVDNYNQTHDRELMKEDIRLKVAETIRSQVDELMRFELENMKVVIERAKRAASKKKGKKGKKKKEKKNKKKKKGKKGKKDKDLTKDRKLDDLYEELVINGIIHKTENVRLDDFLGEYSYTGCITQASGLNPLPSLADVRRLVLEYAVLPLGSQQIHTMAPLNRSVLLTGLRESGKTMLVNAICTEVGANLFDIRPSNMLGKYNTKEGKKMILHLLMKVGKAMEPSIFWLDDCEVMFLKKKDKKDKAKSPKWVKPFKKTFKKIKNGDRMMMIGTTRRPYLCKNSLTKFFQRMILIPPPDYGSRYLTWRHFITELSGLKTLDLDLTSLTKVTTGFTIKAIKATCTEILTSDRLEDVNTFKPLSSYEFVQKIACYDPIYRAEHEAFINWFEKTPAMKNRLQRLGISSSGDKKKDKKGGKKGGKKGKGKGKGGKKKKKK